MRIARIATVHGPVPSCAGQRPASTRQGSVLEGPSGVAKGTKSGDDAGRREVGQTELVEEARQ